MISLRLLLNVKCSRQNRVRCDQKVHKKNGSLWKSFLLQLKKQSLNANIIVMKKLLFGLNLIYVRRLAYEKKRTAQGLATWVFRKAPQAFSRESRKNVPGFVLRKGFNYVSVWQFCNFLQNLYVKYQFEPTNIYNADETGITKVANELTIRSSALQERKQVAALSSAERGPLVTVEACTSAAGYFMAPMVVFPRNKASPKLMDHSPPGSWAVYHKSGWIQKDMFVSWFKKFLEFSNPSTYNQCS